ncbi:phage tail protein [Loktanella sp. 3ANDIMAR09]|uniref:phage major tail tube protein n=1 Tax=Loktanella sp. 3ANDIMAR09 TaxID=1225657 RepID=UPI0006F48AB3|nr:phage major tail tube protein [Loktanella sp. 3ANDIMAR09]KQI69383.1 phage tail protein [Loktanella sp. 3ANDIMAR09]
MVQKIGQITNADLYLNGTDVKGRVSSFEMDGEETTEIEHNTLGMVAVLALPARPLKALKGKIAFDWLDEELERTLMNPTKRHTAQLHSYVDIFDENGLNLDKSHTLVTHVGFHFMKRSGFKPALGEKVGVEHAITIPSFSQKVYGGATPIIEVDVFAGIYNVNGEPVWPT